MQDEVTFANGPERPAGATCFANFSDSEPYAFISYCHRDSELVLPVLKKLEAKGLRLWYDSGIEVGSEWPEYIANALMNCSCVIAFITPNAILSQNCRREINFAVEKRMDMIAAYLEPTKLTPGMELQLNTLQAIFRESFADDDAFADSLASASLLKTCITPVEEPAAEEKPAVEAAPAEEEPGAEAAVAEPEAAEPAEAAPAEPAPVEPETAEPTPAEPTPATAAQPALMQNTDVMIDNNAKNKKKKTIRIIIIALVVIIAASIAFVCYSNYKEQQEAEQRAAEKQQELVESAAAREEILARATPLADKRLVGCWKTIALDYATESDVTLSKYGLGFTFSGTYFGKLLAPADYENALYPVGTVTIDGDTLEFEKTYPKLEGLSITYSLSKAAESDYSNVSDSYKPLYENADNTLMTLHITGQYQKSPTVIQDVDITVTLLKELPIWSKSRMIDASMDGTWDDNFGNTWTISYNLPEGKFEISMQTSDGSNYPGKFISASYENDYETIDFAFEDSNVSIRDAVILSFDGTTMELTEKDGTPLTLTRR